MFLVSSYLSQDQSQLRKLRVEMGKSNNMAKNRRKVTHNGRPILKSRGFVHSKRDVRTFDACPKSHKHAQGIFYDGIARGHTLVFDTRDQQYMIVSDGW